MNARKGCNNTHNPEDILHVPLVELPGVLDGNVHLVGLLEGIPQGSDGTLQERGVGDVELEVVLVQKLASSLSLLSALGGKRAIIPTSELILVVPGGLSVSEKHHLETLLCHGKRSKETLRSKWLARKSTNMGNSSDQHY